ncbi:MAG: hypothetical protein HY240_04490 [Actinobacteria bacterium]|nr:hypothetical protein [Actinomycetota bacterium]
MWVFPLIATLIALVFAGLLARRYSSGRRAYQIVWAAALLMYAGGSFALFLGVLDGWSSAEYRAYWLLGAILNVPYLALGEVYLLFRRAGNALLVVVLFLTGFALNRVRTAGLDVSALTKNLPLGKDVFARDTTPYRLSQLYAYPAYVFLLAGCAWSVWRMRGKPELRDRKLGTVGIAAGATLVAIGSGIGAGLDVVPLFSVGLATGIAVMFWGFLRASRPAT